MTGTPAAIEQQLPPRPLRDLRSGMARMICGGEQVRAGLADLSDRSLFDRAWSLSRANPRPYVGELDDVLVLPNSRLVFDRAGNARSDEMEAAFRWYSLRPKRWDMEIAAGPALRFALPPESEEVVDAGIHLSCEHEANYFHWTCEILPRLHLYQRLLPQERALPLLVSAGLHENLYALLELVCTPGRSIRRLDPARLHRVERLRYPSDVSRILDVYERAPGTDTTYLHVGLLRDMAAKVRRATHAARLPGARKLFIRRNSTYRRLLNEAEVEAWLSRRGFTVVDPGALPLGEQVALFAQAETVVGASGAAMTNMLWCDPGTQVLILHSDHPFKRYPYWSAVARAAGARVRYLPGPRAHAVEGLFAAHDDFSIAPASLQQMLEGTGTAANPGAADANGRMVTA